MIAADIEDIYELSPMQQGILHHVQFAANSEQYYTRMTCRLQGELNVDAFRRAWAQVIERHPSLRTSFHTEEFGKPVQVVHSQVELPLTEFDWRGVDPAEQAAKLEAFLVEDQRRGFDVAAAPVVRIVLIRLADDAWQFFWSHNHLLIDGWSTSIVVKEVFAHYEMFRQGQGIPLPKPRAYGDYIEWLQRQNLSQAEQFWRQQLAAFTSATQVRAERTAARALKSEDGHDKRREYRFSPAETAELMNFVRQHQLTLNVLVQGAWALMLARYSGDNDVCYGATVSGRPPELTGIDGTIGLFINTLPHRVRVPNSSDVLGWLKGMQAQQAEIRQFEYSPLVQVQRWSDIPLGQPLFETIFIYENYPVDTSLASLRGGVSMHDLRYVTRFNHPLTIIAGAGEELMLRLCYDARRYDEPTILRMLGHLQNLLRSFVAQPTGKLNDVPLLDQAERNMVLGNGIDSAKANGAKPFVPPIGCAHELFEAQVAATPEAPALRFEGEQLTFRELNERANQLAHHLRGMGVGPEVLVGVCLERSLEFVVGLLGILKAGGAYLPLDPNYPAARLEYMLTDSQAGILLTQQKLADRLPAGAQRICLDTDWKQIAAGSKENPPSGASLDNLAYVIYTSGSTGRPKGTMLSHRGLGNLAAVQREAFEVGPESRVLQFASLSFDASVSEVFVTLLAGATLVLAPAERLLPGAAFAQLLRDEAISEVTLPPSFLAVLSPNGQPQLRTLVSAGEACTADLVDRWSPDRKMLNAYGPTEATVCTTIGECKAGAGAPPTIGRPIDNLRVLVLDRALRPAPIGVPGELFIASAGLARGYLGRPELTAEKFIPHPFADEPGLRLYRTGDLCRWRADGEIEYLGRIDEQVKIRGYRIELGEIEAVLAQHLAVRAAAVAAREDSPGEKRLVAYVVLEEGQLLTVADVQQHLRESLPEYMAPSALVTLDKLPISPAGKVDRRALPAPDSARPDLADAFVAPRTPLEEYLAGLWIEVLGVDRVGIHDHFFQLGGDSIQGAIVINKLQDKLEEYVYAVALFDAPNIANLSKYLVDNYPDAVRTHFGAESLSTGGDKQSKPIGPDEISGLRGILRALPPRAARNGELGPKNKPAVFILSPARSGSTLLRVMLGGHPQLFSPPALHLLNFNTLEERHGVFGNSRDDFWLEGAVRALMELRGCDVDEAKQSIDDFTRKGMTIRAFYGHLQSLLGERIFVDKTWQYTLDLPTLRRAEEDFEGARYIHLIRDPRAMIASFEEARTHVFFPPLLTADHHYTPRQLAELTWTICHENTLAFLKNVPAERQLAIRFEDMLRDPQSAMEQAASLAGVPFDPSMLEPYQDKKKRMTDSVREDAPMLGDIKFHEHKSINPEVADRWRSRKDQTPLGAVTRELAESFGYEINEPEIEEPAPAAAPGRGPGIESVGGDRRAQEMLDRIDELSPDELADLLAELQTEGAES